MSSTDERILENVAQAHNAQVSVAAVSGADTSVVPIVDLNPALSELEHRFWTEWWEKRHPKPPPLPDQLGPWSVKINFADPIPVGGWAQLTLRRDGSWNFSGHLHDSGTPSYDDSVVWAVKNLGTDEIYLFAHTGHMNGTVQAGSRDDDWDNSGTNAELASGWASLFSGGYHWSCKSAVGIDANSLIDAAEKAVGAAATVISFL